jgi:hypothetical protein
MNLRHLQTFVGVADAGGLRRAAGRVNLSQPAISRQEILETDRREVGYCSARPLPGDGAHLGPRSIQPPTTQRALTLGGTVSD